MSSVAFFVGALVAGYILMKLSIAVVKRMKKPRDQYSKILLAGVFSLIIVTLIAGFGMADGGRPKFAEAFTSYVLPIAILVVIELVVAKKRSEKDKTCK